MPDIDVHFRVHPRDALEFMTNLARDDDFRRKVASNPVAVLAAYDIHVVPSGHTGSAELEGAPDTPAARLADFERWEGLLEERVRELEGNGFKHQGLLPPKHVVEEALVNQPNTNEFGAREGFTGIDPFGFWLMFPLTAT